MAPFCNERSIFNEKFYCFSGRRGAGAQRCDCNATVVGSIPTRSNDLLYFINIFTSSLWPRPHQGHSVESCQAIEEDNSKNRHFHIYFCTFPAFILYNFLYYLFIHSFSFIHSFIHSLTHSLTHYNNYVVYMYIFT